MKPTEDEILFLKESNAIEGVFDDDSLKQAIYAWEYLAKEKDISTGTVLRAHKTLMLHQKLRPDEKGYWRKIYVQVGDRICPDPHTVPESMRHWVVNANDIVVNGQNENKDFLAGVIERHHVEFEKIHPFVDGNGRVGRMLLNTQRLRVGLPILVIYEKEKWAYYQWFQ